MNIVLVALMCLCVVFCIFFYTRYKISDSLNKKLLQKVDDLTADMWDSAERYAQTYRKAMILELEILKNELIETENLDDESRTSTHNNSIKEIIDREIRNIENGSRA